RGRAPLKPIVVRPLDAVQWALYYPAILDPSEYAEFLPATLEKLERYTGPHTTKFFFCQASLWLEAGQIEKAEQAMTQAADSAALVSAEKAVRLRPDDPRTLAVLGFVRLTRYETGKAAEIFRRAIALDDSSGLPHLGLGLALIRQNKLREGRRELEVAAHLDP